MEIKSTIVIACDHAGYQLKLKIKEYLENKGINTLDVGTDSTESCDYPDYGHKLGALISSEKYDKGISICGSGNGINIVSNKHKGVRAAYCWNVEIAELARQHNDANVCSLPARFIDTDLAIEIVDAFLNTNFEGGRHERRKNKIDI